MMGILLEGQEGFPWPLDRRAIREMADTSEIGFPAPINVGARAMTPVGEQEISATLPLRLMHRAKSGYSTASRGYRPFDVSFDRSIALRAQGVVERTPTS